MMTQVTPFTADQVLHSLRQLPPRERLRVVAQVLPELERDLPVSSAAEADFWHGVEMRALIDQQAVPPVKNFDDLLGGWPEDESLDEFLAALRVWRQQNLMRSDGDGRT